MHIITGLPQIGFNSGVMIGEEEWRLRSMDGGEGAAGSEQRQPHNGSELSGAEKAFVPKRFLSSSLDPCMVG